MWHPITIEEIKNFFLPPFDAEIIVTSFYGSTDELKSLLSVMNGAALYLLCHLVPLDYFEHATDGSFGYSATPKFIELCAKKYSIEPMI